MLLKCQGSCTVPLRVACKQSSLPNKEQANCPNTKHPTVQANSNPAANTLQHTHIPAEVCCLLVHSAPHQHCTRDTVHCAHRPQCGCRCPESLCTCETNDRSITAHDTSSTDIRKWQMLDLHTLLYHCALASPVLLPPPFQHAHPTTHPHTRQKHTPCTTLQTPSPFRTPQTHIM